MIYLDTSVLVALLVPETASPAVRGWLARHEDAGFTTSDWTLVEFASAMGIKVRSKGLNARQARDATELLGSLVLSRVGLATPSRASFAHAAALLGRFHTGLRGGDALHLAVASEVGAERMATLDAGLAKAARALKLATGVVIPT